MAQRKIGHRALVERETRLTPSQNGRTIEANERTETAQKWGKIDGHGKIRHRWNLLRGDLERESIVIVAWANCQAARRDSREKRPASIEAGRLDLSNGFIQWIYPAGGVGVGATR